MQHPYFPKRPDTATGAFVMGIKAYTRKENICPIHLPKKDQRAWCKGWNTAASDCDDPARQKVPVVKPRSPRKKSLEMGEAGVIREAVAIAKARGWYVERRNTGAVQTGKYFFRYGSPGAADLIVVVDIDGLPVHIETEAKRRDGKGRLSESQREFRELMGKYQIPYIIFTSGKEFESQIDQICLDLKTSIG